MNVKYFRINANEGKFVFLHGNRKVPIKKSDGTIILSGRQELVNSLRYGQIYPILCLHDVEHDTYVVLDGQHRLKALQILDLPVEVKLFTIKREGRTIEKIESLEKELINHIIKGANSTPVPWDREQHFKWNIEFNKDETYIKVKRLIDSNPNLDANFLYNIISGKTSGFKEDLHNGTLVLKEFSEDLLNIINNLSGTFINYRKNSLKLLGNRKAVINGGLYLFLSQNPNFNLSYLRNYLTSDDVASLDISSSSNMFKGLTALL